MGSTLRSRQALANVPRLRKIELSLRGTIDGANDLTPEMFLRALIRAIPTMPLSLISYFSTMVTACVVSMAIMSHLVTPHTFRQPHPVIVSKDSATSAEPIRASSVRSFGTAFSHTNAATAVLSEPPTATKEVNQARHAAQRRGALFGRDHQTGQISYIRSEPPRRVGSRTFGSLMPSYIHGIGDISVP
jgi:hypothetical protein